MFETQVVEGASSAPAQVTKSIMDYFPLPTPRRSQQAVIEETERAFRSGKRIVILEAPVGSGKSAIAMTFAAASGSSHVITPRKSLQDQYHDDFSDDVVLMKGRGAYPCTYDASARFYAKTIKDIKDGRVKAPLPGEPDCASAPCRNSETLWKSCTGGRPCPYSTAIEVAQEHHTVVHNIHSFIFQTNFGGKFERRSIMIIDEAHEIENVIRGFITKKFSLSKAVDATDVPDCKTVEEWCDWFSDPEFVPLETAADQYRKQNDETYESERDKYLGRVEALHANHEYYGTEFTVKQAPILAAGRPVGTSFEFIPHSIGLAAHKYLFDYGDQVLLMSGTIYDKDTYCRLVGINPEDAYFIRVPSSFPVANRPIYMKQDYQVDTSHRMWEENFPEMIEKIRKIMGIFHNAKGLIHAPSYDAMYQIAEAIGGDRIMVHEKGDLQDKLEAFYGEERPLVFISPVCQQGVDFKGDRARFQIVTRVPYANTQDPFMAYKVENDFQWYNYQALIVFGQMVGRVNRAEDDYGATFLMDQRFNRFVSRNSKKLPRWLQAAFIYK